MAGDTNLFNLNGPEGVAEIEVMIAEPKFRRRGLGREAVSIMIAYAVQDLGVSKLQAKIGESNTPSQALFRSLGFREVSRSEVFREVTFELPVDEPTRSWATSVMSEVGRREYDQRGK
mmetsp:Transcript_16438/g.39022  ORF Transcript_16438/g.39022 Transcript_16438/m.39022 type:complete len:118 (-) Transcript_16438:244-597(-)